MNPNLKLPLIPAGLIALLLAAMPGLAQENIKVITKTLLGSEAHKECLTVTETQKLRYWYRAERPINFAIQYVDGKETIYPVRRDKEAIGSGSFAPKSAQTYCMVWTNVDTQAVLFRMEFARLARQ